MCSKIWFLVNTYQFEHHGVEESLWNYLWARTIYADFAGYAKNHNPGRTSKQGSLCLGRLRRRWNRDTGLEPAGALRCTGGARQSHQGWGWERMLNSPGNTSTVWSWGPKNEAPYLGVVAYTRKPRQESGMSPRVCLSLPNSEITGMSHHTGWGLGE